LENILSNRILELSAAIYPRAKGIREHLHAHPELSWNESNTAKYIQSILDEHHISYTANIATHGIVASISGINPTEKCIALRADMDALPIQEISDMPYASCEPGVMHACGHDVHMACLLGAAIVLHQLKDQISGTIKIIFQPSEEKQPSGAEAMILAGVLVNPKVDAIIGMHVTPELESGKIGYHLGEFMASADEVYLTVKGKGGHAAQPHKIIDPLLIASHILIALQQIVSRNANPSTPTVLSFGDMHAHGATNVIPDEVSIKGTLRTFDESWRMLAHQKIESICKGIAQGMGGDCDVNIPAGLPLVSNDKQLTEKMLHQLGTLFSEDQLMEMPIRMGSEDFGFYSQKIPACFLRLGTRKANAPITNLHTSSFDIDEQSILTGIRLFCAAAL
jgi:hippurate hydrolase